MSGVTRGRVDGDLVYLATESALVQIDKRTGAVVRSTPATAIAPIAADRCYVYFGGPGAVTRVPRALP